MISKKLTPGALGYTYCFKNLNRQVANFYVLTTDIQDAYEHAVAKWPHEAIYLYKIISSANNLRSRRHHYA